MSLALAAVTGILFAAGTWLLLQRRLTRIIIGIGLLGHGANLLLVTSGGRAGNPGHRRIGWEPRRIFRPPSTGTCPHGNRHHLRCDRISLGTRLSQLANQPRRQG